MILRRVEVALALNKTLMLKLHFQKPNIDLYFESVYGISLAFTSFKI